MVWVFLSFGCTSLEAPREKRNEDTFSQTQPTLANYFQQVECLTEHYRVWSIPHDH